MPKDNPTPPADTPAPATRTRLSFSKDKKLAFLVMNLVAILTSKAVAAVLDEDQKLKISKAAKTAKEIGGENPLEPTQKRIQEIQKELKAIDYGKDLDKAVAQAKELASELDRQIKRKKQIEELING